VNIEEVSQCTKHKQQQWGPHLEAQRKEHGVHSHQTYAPMVV
jgi:hypothetical protein